MAGYGLGAWMTRFYQQVHHQSPADYGVVLALLIAFGGGGGALLGGFLSDSHWLRARGLFVAPSLVLGVMQLLTVPCMILTFYVSSLELSYAFMGATYVFGETWLGPAVSLAQRLQPAHPGGAVAYFTFCTTIVSAGLGPQLVGWLSDYVWPSDDGLRLCVLAVLPGSYFLSSLVFLWLAVVTRDRAHAVVDVVGEEEEAVDRGLLDLDNDISSK